MIVTRRPLYDKEQTAKEMYYLVKKYFDDLNKYKIRLGGKTVPLSSLTIKQFFNLVKNIPYRRDEKPVEVVSRPKFILQNRRNGMDCKKKGILLGAFLRANNLPYRFTSISRKPSGRIHHVFPQVYINGMWRNLDATYSHYKPFQRKKVTAVELL